MAEDARAWRPTIARLVLAALVSLTAFWSVYQLQPPPAVSADAPAAEFSSGRAMRHLATIAARPHPIGSLEHERVRDYLLQELTALGLDPQVQAVAVARYRSARSIRLATVHNVVGRIPGTGAGRAILLLSHYDTVINAPGATDDGSGVVTVLETLRALTHHAPLRNDVIFLFTDGEERGLLGAQAFSESHPWMNDIDLVLNFEGSGSAGQSLMFETSPDNRWLIREFARAAPHPSANSTSYEIYRRMPNDTDYSVFKDRGIAGLNFSCIDDRFDYHTLNDSVANIDERIVQHHGSNGLALTLHFGNLDLGGEHDGNAVYFNTVGFGFVDYHERWVLPLAGITLVGLVVVLVLGFRAGELQLAGLLKGLVAFPVGLIAAPFVVLVATRILDTRFTGLDRMLLVYNQKVLLAGFLFLTLGIYVLMYTRFRRGFGIWFAASSCVAAIVLLFLGDLFRWWLALIAIVAAAGLYFLFRKGCRSWNLAAGALIGWVLIMLGVSIAVPGVSYLVTWPLLLSLVPPAWLFWRRTHDAVSSGNAIWMGLFAIPTVLWFGGFAYMFLIAMGLDMAAGAMVFVILAASLLIPHLEWWTSRNAWLLSAVFAAAGIVVILSGSIGAGFDDRYPRVNSLYHATSADTGEATWGSMDQEPDEWTSIRLTQTPASRDLSDLFPGSSTPVLVAPAPPIDSGGPLVELVEDSVDGQDRTLRLRVTSSRSAPILHLFFPPDAGIIGGAVDGRTLGGLPDPEPAGEDWWQWRYYGLPSDGFELILRLDSHESLRVRALDFSYGLPGLSEDGPAPRPPGMMPDPQALTDVTIAAANFEL